MVSEQVITGIVSVDKVKISYELRGKGETLVLLHAGIADMRMWEPQFEVFSRRFQVLRYDLRGYGNTTPVSEEYFHHLDLKALLEMLEIQNASLVGSSLGGTVALDFALECPEMVTALVLVSASPGGFEFEGDSPPQWEELSAAFKAGDFERAAELEVQMWVDGPQRGPEKVDSSIRDLVRAMDRIALANEALGVGARLSLDPPAIDRLGEISIPSLVLYGELDDPNVTRAGDLLAENLRGAKKVIMAGTAHFPNLERSEIFNQIVLGFLSNPAFGSR